MLVHLEEYSTLALYSAMFIYAIAFVFYVVDLANRSGDREVAVGAASSTVTGVRGAEQPSAGTVTLTQAAAPPSQRSTKQEGADAPRSRSLRIGFSLTVLGAILHLAATVLRGIGAERLPFANMYEFALTATCAIVLVFLVVQFFVDIRFLGALITGMAVIFLGITKINYYVSIVPLQPALDTYWLVIHILVAVLGVAFLTLSFGLSVLQLMQTKRAAHIAAGGDGSMRWLATIPSVARLEDLAYRMAIIGFMFWTFTLIAGSIWAERAWSRYWGWDTKEVWTFVIWVLYAGFIHARATRGWRGTRSAWLSIIAYSAVIFNYAIVNVFFDGLHAYSGL